MVLTRQQLLDAAWGPDFYGDDHVLDVHIGRLRRKLDEVDQGSGLVETVRGVGFRLTVPG